MLAEWIKEIKEVEESEAKIATRNNKKEIHNMKWGPSSSLMVGV